MLDINQLIESGGILLIALIVFAESGLLLGFFLPGDTLLFGAGLLASQGELSILPLILVIIAAAIVGDNVGYSIGQRAGPRIFRKKDGIIFRQEYIEKAEAFYEKHGGKTIVLARFIPIIRTFAPVVAGAGKMSRRRFMFFNIAGGTLWGAGITLLGYWFGQRIPHLDQYIEYVIIGVVVASLGLSMLHLLKDKETRQKLKIRLRDILLNKKNN
ncbi:VTT domain-containing protein [Candidatus Saccharibacteria bacterium]|nr:VTT domain-containing protein [Candidatus Saccharibacteria bacterium]MBI3338365.1 VTT domain-containing protein [Candidatus Saccharibacteria bacterium]